MEASSSFSSKNPDSEHVRGFNFELFRRNEMILRSTSQILPKATSTGTTIVGIIYRDGVILGADTRATGGSEVVDKNCEKIHYIAPNIYCCGAGTAADTEKVTEMMASHLELLRLSTRSASRVISACTLLKRLLYRYQGQLGAALILGGVDITGPHLYTIHPHGSASEQPYLTMGSGCLAAMSVFETRYREGLEEDEGVQIVRDAILAGIFNDLGSGSNVDVTIIRSDGSTERRRNFVTPNQVSDWRGAFARPTSISISRGATEFISERFQPVRALVDVSEVEPESL